MYILLIIDSDNYTFTTKDESGTDIGTPYIFAVTDYKLDIIFLSGFARIYPIDAQVNDGNPVFQCSMERIVLSNPDGS